MAIDFIRANLYYDDEKSFRHALDEAQIEYRNILIFSTGEDKKDSIIGIIGSLSDAMPWNTLAKVIIAWVNARKEREVIFTQEDNTTFHAKGYSASEVSKMLSSCINLTVINDNDNDNDNDKLKKPYR